MIPLTTPWPFDLAEWARNDDHDPVRVAQALARGELWAWEVARRSDPLEQLEWAGIARACRLARWVLGEQLRQNWVDENAWPTWSSCTACAEHDNGGGYLCNVPGCPGLPWSPSSSQPHPCGSQVLGPDGWVADVRATDADGAW